MVLAAGWLPSRSVADMTKSQSTAQSIDIAGGALGPALNQLGRMAEVVISYEPAAVRGKTTHGVRSAPSIDLALDQLLAATGLRAESDGVGGYVVAALPVHPEVAASQSRPSSAAAALPAKTTLALDEVVVSGSAYRGEVSSGGARIDANVKELPLSISVVTKALIDDRQIRNLRDLSENVAGVRSRQSGGGAFAIDFTVRGLQFGSVAVNGYRVDNFSAGYDPQSVERVEFLKGPASVLYGASGALSGLVNIVTKTPQADNFLKIDVTGGAPLYGRLGADGNIKLTDTLESRTNVAVTHEDRIDALRDVEEQFISEALRWHPTAHLSFLAEGSYIHSLGPSRSVVNRPADQRFAQLPRNFKLGERYDRVDDRGITYRIEGNWEVLSGLTLHQGFNRQRFKTDEVDVRPNGLIAPDEIARIAYTNRGVGPYEVSQSELRWNFNAGPTKHKFLAGYEYSY
jgi:iron complex outermembrane recepter protein